MALSGSRQEIVPVEIVEDGAARRGSTRAGSMEPSGQFRVVLGCGLRIEVEAGFDAAALRRLIAALDSAELRGCLRPPV
jgi:hypothetical protein